MVKRRRCCFTLQNPFLKMEHSNKKNVVSTFLMLKMEQQRQGRLETCAFFNWFLHLTVAAVNIVFNSNGDLLAN